MAKLFRWTFRGALLLLLAVTLFVLHSLYFKPVSIRIFYERVFAEFALESPQIISSLGMLPPSIDWTADELDDYSLAKGEEQMAKLKADLATLRSYDRAALDDALSYDVLEVFLQTQADGERFRFHDYPLNQLFGIQSSLPSFMASQHRVAGLAGAEAYVARLREIPRVAAQVREGMAQREQLGIIPPTFVVEKVTAEMQAFVATEPKQNILYTALADKMAKADEAIAEAEQQRLLADAEAVIREQVYPAYQGWIDDYVALLPKTTGNHGVWALPDGEAFYQHQIRVHTTIDMTPEQVHELGLREVARIEGEMDAILQGEGLAVGTIGERVRTIAARPDQLYPDTDEGRAQILADYQAMIDTIDAGLGPHFNVRPTQPVKVERIPEFKEKTSPGAYYQPPALDGSRPGVFYANLRSVQEIPRFSMRTLAYHEGIPGHHFQLAIQQKIQGVPTFRKLLPFTAYSEGWALYSEKLASEIGFQPTPLDDLGRLQAEMFRAVRLVVDSGLHHKRWTREQAIDYMVEKTGMPQTDVVAEIERYLVMPGQALAYKVGMNTIVELRDEAKRELGEGFDLAAFHDVVLTNGSLPMTLLQQQVRAWIAAEKAKAGGVEAVAAG
ncbi:DUF885 family protein [Silanimonas sp.]|jgi:uncharacterized protein (DUF885 family)|uniref:DUF885 domain-containing protein n=1 Tax=Silanimonas sp. TaxID=1929290 RepID=UPI0022CC231A|nr:DUF885 domain-containing protein [Silanimonas sp.]MCZ8063333.1 DUF885 domain-containing protein [Silanimonas sp.]